MDTRILLDRAPNQRDSKIIVVNEQDVEPILERNKALQGEEQRSDWGRHVASVPNVVLLWWLNAEHARGNTQLRMFTPEFNALVQRKLQDRDWMFLRVDK